LMPEWRFDVLVHQRSSPETAASFGGRSAELGVGELNPAFARIRGIAGLAENWDSYGASPPSRDALAQARWVLGTLRHRFPGLKGRLSPVEVAPLADGGVQLEWERRGGTLELEINPDGTFSYLHIGGNGEERKFVEKDRADLDEVLFLVVRTVIS
jgi:hypothetical protein